MLPMTNVGFQINVRQRGQHRSIWDTYFLTEVLFVLYCYYRKGVYEIHATGFKRTFGGPGSGGKSQWWHTPLIPMLWRQRRIDLCE